MATRFNVVLSIGPSGLPSLPSPASFAKGYEVAFTMGNHPTVDLMVRSPKGTSFGVDVKGLYKPNFWAVKAKVYREQLFYVFAYVPDEAHNKYFILNQTQVNAEIAAEIERCRLRAQSKGRSEEKIAVFPGVRWKLAEQYKDAWETLPDYAARLP